MSEQLAWVLGGLLLAIFLSWVAYLDTKIAIARIKHEKEEEDEDEK